MAIEHTHRSKSPTDFVNTETASSQFVSSFDDSLITFILKESAVAEAMAKWSEAADSLPVSSVEC